MSRAISTVENSWLAYIRMLGATTTSCVAGATLLHQLQCELSHQPTHWLAASLLVAVSTISFAIVVTITVESPSYSTFLLGVCAVAMALSISFLELCDVHLAFSATILCIDAVAFWLFLRGDAREIEPKSRSGHERLGSAQNADASDADHAIDSEDEPASDDVQELQSVQSRPIWKWHAGWILLGVGFAIYMIVVPTIGLVIDWLNPVTIRKLTDMTLAESIRLHTVSGVVMLMFLAMGASIGSFLNVIIYRLPRSIPLLWPPSACANCRTQLRGKDNIPILAWLKLGGRCRYCNTPISFRYPLIEAVVAVVFVLFYYRELLSGGQNLPVREPNLYRGIVWILLYTKWDLVTNYLFHMFLLVLLLAVGMINYDRFRVPVIAAVICCGTVLGISGAFPHLNPTSNGWSDYADILPVGVAASLAGCIGGIVLGLILEFLLRFRRVLASDLTSTVNDSAPVAEDAVGENAVADYSVSDDETGIEAHPIDGLAKPDPYGVASPNPSSAANATVSLTIVGAALGIEAVVIVFLFSILFTALVAACRPILLARFAGAGRAFPSTLSVFLATAFLLFAWDSARRLVTEFVTQRI